MSRGHQFFSCDKGLAEAQHMRLYYPEVREVWQVFRDLNLPIPRYLTPQEMAVIKRIPHGNSEVDTLQAEPERRADSADADQLGGDGGHTGAHQDLSGGDVEGNLERV